MTGYSSKTVGSYYTSLFEGGKVWYTSKEAAAILGVSVQFVRDAFESQAIMGHEVSAQNKPAVRRIKMIHRDCLLIYLMETANFSAQDFLVRLQGLLKGRSPEELEKIKAWIDGRLAVNKGAVRLG